MYSSIIQKKVIRILSSLTGTEGMSPVKKCEENVSIKLHYIPWGLNMMCGAERKSNSHKLDLYIWQLLWVAQLLIRSFKGF